MSSVLTENIVLSRTRSQDLRNVRKLNCWGSELKDVSIVKKLVNVEVLSLSLNNISSLQCFGSCKFLQELYLRKNCISNLNELCYLQHLPYLRKLWLAENPCAEKTNYRMTVIRALPNLETLDNVPVSSEEVSKAQTQGDEIYDPSECNFQEALKSTPNRDLEYDSNEDIEENNRDDSYEKDEVKSPKLTEKAFSTPSPTQQQQLNKNQRFSYPEVGQQWIPPKDMSPPRPANVIPPTMLRGCEA
ncbi:uncharacterized protein B4U80_01329 [Leptotrombidium deliense]|uniref:U2A'/phosphoprotein 32 family A C-terminal domain-containing protein n=1 Tax=Leptotrombidium deliense TaxID=299467 RepID=A0A443SIU7_9ACAR|nr:uncharacterized protein B4U80_01329 [Leptotrombidium deliense]